MEDNSGASARLGESGEARSGASRAIEAGGRGLVVDAGAARLVVLGLRRVDPDRRRDGLQPSSAVGAVRGLRRCARADAAAVEEVAAREGERGMTGEQVPVGELPTLLARY